MGLPSTALGKQDRAAKAELARKRSILGNALCLVGARPSHVFDARIRFERLTRQLKSFLRKLPKNLGPEGSHFNPPGLECPWRGTHERDRRQERQVGVMLGVPHGFVADQNDPRLARAIGKSLTGLVIDELRPNGPIGVERRAHQIECRHRAHRGVEGGELAGVFWPGCPGDSA